MVYVKAKYKEDIGSLLKRFKKSVERSGVLADYKKNEFYEKPSVKRKKKHAAAVKRIMKKEKKLAAKRRGKNRNFKWNKDKTKKIPLRPRSYTGPRMKTRGSGGNANHTKDRARKTNNNRKGYNK